MRVALSEPACERRSSFSRRPSEEGGSRLGPGDLGRSACSARASGAPVARGNARAAREVAGSGTTFAPFSCPCNLAMAQAIVYRSQETDRGRLPALSAAREAGLAAFGSASLLQGRLAGDLPEEIEAAFPEAASGAQRALQFSRSAPGMTTSLVGVSTLAHAEDDFALAQVPPAAAGTGHGALRGGRWRLGASRRSPEPESLAPDSRFSALFLFCRFRLQCAFPARTHESARRAFGSSCPTIP